MSTIEYIDDFLNSTLCGEALYNKCNLDWSENVHLVETYDDCIESTKWTTSIIINDSNQYFQFDDKSNTNLLIKGLLTAFNSTDQNIAKAVRCSFVDTWYKKLRGENLKDGNNLPLLILIQRKKIEGLPDDKPQIVGSQKTKYTFNYNLKHSFSFLNNSSIWLRLIDSNDKAEINNAIQEFEYFRKIGLYNYGASKEYLDYNIRLQKNNYLEDISHGNYVTPLLYGNEVEALEVLKRNYVEIENKNSFGHEFKLMKTYHSVRMRILLIDDKLGHESSDGKYVPLIDSNNDEFASISIKECTEEECKKCNRSECKLRTLKQLMDDGNGNSEKKDVFSGIGVTRDYFYWKETNIKTFYCPTIIKDFIDDEIDDEKTDFSRYEKGINVFTASENADTDEKKRGDESKKALNIKCEFTPPIDSDNLNIQIVGVRDVRTALLLMSKYKFDMIFCDYLLDKKENGLEEEREYSNQLFDFLSYDYKNEIKNEEKKETKDDKRISRLKVLSQLRRDVLDNRGPLDKLWIMPITGFNQTFIQDLYRNKIDLIGHKWNISNGADPITTPWQFLYHFNKFIELQLKYCVYDMSHLLRFLLYTWEDLDDKLKKSTRRNFFYTFQAFMGSEYANFMRRYGNRHIIQRDAYKDESDEKSDKSIFATYIWREFYANHKNRDVIELNRLIQRFLYQAATMHNDRDGQQRLEETFGQLCFFIDINKKVRDAISNENDLSEKLDEALKKFREKMDELTSNRHNENRKG